MGEGQPGGVSKADCGEEGINHTEDGVVESTAVGYRSLGTSAFGWGGSNK